MDAVQDVALSVMCTVAVVGIVIELVLDAVIWALKAKQRRASRGK